VPITHAPWIPAGLRISKTVVDTPQDKNRNPNQKMKTLSAVFVVMSAIFVVTACSPSRPKAGQVTGVLYHADGTRYSKGVAVIATNANEIKTHFGDDDGKYVTNDKGEFTLWDVKPGDNCLYLLAITPPPFDRTPGVANPPMPTIICGRISSKGTLFHFVLAEHEGLDLGKIEVTEVTR
jgi:hypothetical protein